MPHAMSILLGLVLGAVFVVTGVLHFLHLLRAGEAPTAGSPAALFMSAMRSSGYLDFVKVVEIAGGVLVAIPCTQFLGLLLLVPVTVNILAFHIFLRRGVSLLEPPVVLITALSLLLLWEHRRAFASLVEYARPRR